MGGKRSLCPTSSVIWPPKVTHVPVGEMQWHRNVKLKEWCLRRETEDELDKKNKEVIYSPNPRQETLKPDFPRFLKEKREGK